MDNEDEGKALQQQGTESNGSITPLPPASRENNNINEKKEETETECIDLTMDLDDEDMDTVAAIVGASNDDNGNDDSTIIALGDSLSRSQTGDGDKSGMHSDDISDAGSSVIFLSSAASNIETDVEDDDASLNTGYVPFRFTLAHVTLWRTSENFQRMADPFVKLFNKYGEEVVHYIWRAHQRTATVDDFWSYVMDRFTPRSGWIGEWKLVNPERRGWPLQHVTRAEVLVEYAAFGDERSTIKILRVFDSRYEGTERSELVQIPIWQVDPIRTHENFDHEGLTLEGGKEILQLARRFYETIFIAPDNDYGDIGSYFTDEFFQRLELLYYMENPSPNPGVLSTKDRGRIITAIKHHHFLKNAVTDHTVLAIIDSHPLDPGDNMDEDEQPGEPVDRTFEHHSGKSVVYQMQLDQHKVELNFLLKPTLRSLMQSTLPEVTDESFKNYQNVLVIKDASVSELQLVLDQLANYVGDPSSKIRICSDLEKALSSCCDGASIFVASGNYNLTGLSRLSNGGSLIGIATGCSDVTIMPTDDIGDVWFLYNGRRNDSQLVMKNIHLVVDTAEAETQLKTCIQVTSGGVTLENVNIRNLDPNATEESFKPAKISENITATTINCNFTFIGSTENGAISG